MAKKDTNQPTGVYEVQITLNHIVCDNTDAKAELKECITKIKAKSLKTKLFDESDWGDDTTYFFKVSGKLPDLLNLGTELSWQGHSYKRLV